MRQGETKNQATGAILIFRIIFNYFTAYDGLPNFLHFNVALDALIDSMFGEFELVLFKLLLDVLNQAHIKILTMRSSMCQILSVSLCLPHRVVWQDNRA